MKQVLVARGAIHKLTANILRTAWRLTLEGNGASPHGGLESTGLHCQASLFLWPVVA